jgi:ADP-ribose pyrophosphatase
VNLEALRKEIDSIDQMMMSLFKKRMEVSKKIGAGGGVPGELEEIDTIEMDREELMTTRFKDAKTIIAVNWARYNHNVK